MVLSNFKMKMTMIVLEISFSQNAYQTIRDLPLGFVRNAEKLNFAKHA
jgi:hypothetical protein